MNPLKCHNSFVITIVSIFHNRPDFIALQLKSIQKYVASEQISYIVANNARERVMRKEIRRACQKLDIKCIPVRRELWLELRIRLSYRETVFTKRNKYRNVNLACSYAFMYLWKKLLPDLEGQMVCFLDSDMFFMGEFNPTKVLLAEKNHRKSIAFVPIIRSSKVAKWDIYHPWNGLFLANSSSISSLKSLVWHPGQVLGMKLDVGGQAHFWLRENLGTISYNHFTSFSLYFLEEFGDKFKGRVTVNGSFLCEFLILDNESLDMEFTLAGSEAPYLPLNFSYLDKVFGEKKGLEYLQSGILKLLEINKLFHGPNPKYFDLIGIFTQDKFNAMVFHYKSVSNYQQWSSEEYNHQKTQALRNFLSTKESLY